MRVGTGGGEQGLHQQIMAGLSTAQWLSVAGQAESQLWRFLGTEPPGDHLQASPPCVSFPQAAGPLSAREVSKTACYKQTQVVRLSC